MRNPGFPIIIRRSTLSRALAGIEKEREKSTELLTKDWDDPKEMERVILGRLKVLAERQAALEKELAEVEGRLKTFKMKELNLQTVRMALANLRPLLEVASQAEKAQLMGLLVQRIEIAPDGAARVLLYVDTPLRVKSSCYRTEWLPKRDALRTLFLMPPPELRWLLEQVRELKLAA